MRAASAWVRQQNRSAPLFHDARLLTSPVAQLFCLTFVMQLLALGDGNLDFCPAFIIKKYLERHNGHAFPLNSFFQFDNFAHPQKKFARTPPLVIELIGLQIFGDIGIDQKNLAIFGIGIGFADGGLAGAQRFDLGAGQGNPRLEHFANFKIEACLAVIRSNFEI